jgi:hypothetical protein
MESAHLYNSGLGGQWVKMRNTRRDKLRLPRISFNSHKLGRLMTERWRVAFVQVLMSS